MSRRQPFQLYITLLALLLGACQGAPAAEPSLPPPEILSVEGSSATPFQPATPASTASSSPVPLAASSATPDPYAGLSIASLAQRQYGGGELFQLQVLLETSQFTRYLISYPSDGLIINGHMDVPVGEGPFPVVLVLHGYVDPAIYSVQTYTSPYAAAFARNGYIAIHPNYRDYPPSDSGPNLFRVGSAIDVLNLVALVNQQAGQPGALEQADAGAVFLWGHSMGGGITQRVITVGADVQGAVLYGSMSGDEERNYLRIRDFFSDGERGLEELSYPAEAFEAISPIFHYGRIEVPVSIHHGDSDDEVPPGWSSELCTLLTDLDKEVECFSYAGQAHIFNGQSDNLLVERSLDFFQRYIPED